MNREEAKKRRKKKVGRKKGHASNPGAYVPGVKRGARSAGSVPIATGHNRATGNFDEASFGPLGLRALEVKLACKAWLQKRGLEQDDFNFGNIYFQ